MKKQFKNLGIFIGVSVFFLLPISTFASSIILSPQSIEVREGERFKVNVAVVPDGTTSYTVKSSIEFSPDTVLLDTWDFNSAWMPLRQLEYDKFNNSTGVLVRTAGFPGGLNEQSSFGTMTFVAKKSGVANISVNSKDSIVLDANNTNTLTSGNTVGVIIGKAPPKVIAPAITPGVTPQKAKSVYIEYKASLLESEIEKGDKLVILINLDNKNDDFKSVPVTVRSKVFGRLGNEVLLVEDETNAVSRADILQSLDTKKLLPGEYSLINEISYDGQVEPQNISFSFSIINPEDSGAEGDKSKDDEGLTSKTFTALILCIFLSLVLFILILVDKKRRNRHTAPAESPAVKTLRIRRSKKEIGEDKI